MPVIIAILLILLFIILIIYNNLIKKRNAVKQSRSSINVYLTQRFDLIPNLVECVKGYAKHEKKTFSTIANLRTQYDKTKDLDQASELNSQINNLILLAENYPDLKASANFLNLQKNLTKIEDQLQAARRIYNMDVTIFNTSIQTFPCNIIASLFRFREEKLFNLDPSAKENVKIDI